MSLLLFAMKIVFFEEHKLYNGSESLPKILTNSQIKNKKNLISSKSKLKIIHGENGYNSILPCPKTVDSSLVLIFCVF